MAITYRATGITASSDTSTPFANLSYTLPTGHSQGDLLIAFYGGKPYDTVPATPSEYTARSGGANGTTAMGSGTGSVYAIAFTKTHDGSESNPASTFSAQYSPGIRAMLAVVNDDAGSSSTWTVESCKGSDATSTGTSYSATGDATLNYGVGDVAVVSLVHNDDSSSDSAFGLSIPGCTVANITQRLTGTLTTSTGNDGRMYVITADITLGTATGAPVVTATTGSADSDGQSVFLRVHPIQQYTTATAATATASLTTEATVLATHTATVSLSATATSANMATATAAYGVSVFAPNVLPVGHDSAEGYAGIYENGVYGWYNDGASISAVASSYARHGTHVFSCVQTGATQSQPYMFVWSETDNDGLISPTAGKTVTASAWVRPAQSTTGYMNITYSDANHFSNQVTLPANTWTRLAYTVTFDVNATASGVSIGLLINGSINDSYLIDDWDYHLGSDTRDWAPSGLGQMTTFASLTASATVERNTTATATVTASLSAAATIANPKISTFVEDFNAGNWNNWYSHGDSTISGGKATVDGEVTTALVGS